MNATNKNYDLLLHVGSNPGFDIFAHTARNERRLKLIMIIFSRCEAILIAALSGGNSPGQVTAFRLIAQTALRQFVLDSSFAAAEAISDEIGHKLKQRGRPDE